MLGLTQAGAGVGALDDRPLAGVVEHRPLGQGDVSCHSGDGYPGGEHSTHKQEWGLQPQPIPKGTHTTKQALTRFHRSYGIMKEQLKRSAG